MFFRFIVCLLFLGNLTPLAAQDVYLCVWRNPERTMTRIFPEARDYKTVSLPISAEQRQSIEERLGFALLPGQQDRFQYFEMTGQAGRPIGTIIAASQKGEYGAVEFVFGLDEEGIIKGLYVQRARERDQSFKERAFLDRFVGRSIRQVDDFPDFNPDDPSPGALAVIRGLVKEIVCYVELVPAGTGSEQGPVAVVSRRPVVRS